VILLALLPATVPAGPSGEKRAVERADVYITSKGSGDRIARKAAASFAPLEQPDEHVPTIMLDRDRMFQSLVGIGGALTDAAAETFYRLPEAKQKELLTALFDRAAGNGYSLCRTSIHSCDFSSASYSYADTPGDTLLKSFSIAPDGKFKIPFIRAAVAKAGEEFRLFASPWSPPGWMKSNGEMLHGGTLLPRYRQAWADYVVKFVREYEKAGVPLWGLTVQNEPMAVQPWESCIFTAQAERDFVRDYLGPTLEKSGLSRLKLMAWDHNRGIMYQRAKVMFDDPVASRYVWGTAFHWYVGDHFENVRLVHDAYPEKALVFTEGTVENFNASRIGEWSLGETYARSMIHDFNNGANGWVDWNVLLDEAGGPNHVGNFCMAPIICDTKTGGVTYLSSFYYLGHFSRFLRPGARRIIASSNTDDLIATAFQNADGSIAVVVLNTTEKEADFSLWLEQRACTVTSPARSIVTLVL
jgi:glucosylceramidase